MKKILLFLLFIVLTSFMQVGPESTEAVKITWPSIVAIIAGLYEVIVRVIPTVTNYSLIGKVINILVWISDFLNRKKK
jgi:hypothetical protein